MDPEVNKNILIARRKHLRTSVTTISNRNETLPNLPAEQKLAIKTKLNQHLIALQDVDAKIQSLIYDSKNEKPFFDDITTSDRYIERINESIILLEGINQNMVQMSNPMNEARSLLRSPIAPLPNFSGYEDEDLTRFIAQFEDTISKFNYPDYDKFILLKQQLKDRALTLVNSFRNWETNLFGRNKIVEKCF